MLSGPAPGVSALRVRLAVQLLQRGRGRPVTGCGRGLELLGPLNWLVRL